MTQFVFIDRDPLAPDDPNAYVVYPHNLSIWRIDNDVFWKVLAPGHSITDVGFQEDWFAAGGKQPVISADGQTATAVGPPAAGVSPVTYSYTLMLMKPDRTPVRVAKRRVGDDNNVYIDPDVTNQPQP